MWSSYDCVLLADFSLEWGFLRHPTSPGIAAFLLLEEFSKAFHALQ
jgi:hypothetical protein